MGTNLPLPTRIERVITENARTKTFVLDTSLEAQPGQFLMVWLPSLDEKPFSLAGADPLSLTVARVGPFTTAMHKLETGDRLWYRGPLGKGFTLAGENLLLVGGGYGVAPLAFLADEAVRAGSKLFVLIGASGEADVFFEERLGRLADELWVVTEDGSAGRRGLATDAVEEILAGQKIDTLYACGPEGMLERLAKICADHQLPCQLSWEAYMRCGLGLCGSCERDGLLICADGPVLASP
ncbi:MAG: dihydroorotate dehydrogenase electron transfer subunit [Anaerolineae bacterium]